MKKVKYLDSRLYNAILKCTLENFSGVGQYISEWKLAQRLAKWFEVYMKDSDFGDYHNFYDKCMEILDHEFFDIFKSSEPERAAFGSSYNKKRDYFRGILITAIFADFYFWMTKNLLE
jgi:hypothetical protein